MEPSPPLPPRTIIVVDDYPNEVSSFICSVLEAHALPYTVHVMDPGAPAFDHLAPLEPRRAPTFIRLHSPRAPRAGQGFWGRLTALGLAVMPSRGLRHCLQPHTAAPPRTRRRRWPRALVWGVGFGLVVSLVAGAPWLWRAGRLSHVPSSPPLRSDHTAAALLGTAAPVAPPAAEAPLPAQSQTPTGPAHFTVTTHGGTAAGERRQPPQASEARPATSRRPQASPQPRAASRPRAVERARVVGAHRPGAWAAALPAPQVPWWRSAPDPALEMERPWNRRLVNDTGE
jgi:hypothetical protein